jgi:hypothetical protein
VRHYGDFTTLMIGKYPTQSFNHTTLELGKRFTSGITKLARVAKKLGKFVGVIGVDLCNRSPLPLSHEDFS